MDSGGDRVGDAGLGGQGAQGSGKPLCPRCLPGKCPHSVPGSGARVWQLVISFRGSETPRAG